MHTDKAALIALLLLLLGSSLTYAPARREPLSVGRDFEVEPYTVVAMEVTAYTAGYESTGKTPEHPLYGVTASGEMVRRGTVAACRAIPYGTRVYIPNYGYGTVQDRGGAITEGCLDVYMEDLEEALEWGRQFVEVRIYR